MDRLKPATSTPSEPFKYCLPIRVRMADTDAQGIVYHANYLAYCEAGRNEYMRDLDLDYARVFTQDLEMAVSYAWQKYHAPARFDDVVDVWVRVAELRRVAMSFEYELRCRRTNVLLCTAATELACIKRQTRRPTRIPTLVLHTIRRFEGPYVDDRSGRRER